MIIHRDLSCRNCLVEETKIIFLILKVKEEEGKYTIKLADFGLGVVMRPTSADDKTFSTKDSQIPVKWAGLLNLFYSLQKMFNLFL